MGYCHNKQCTYSAEYIKKWDKTILNLVIQDNDDNFTEYTTAIAGELIVDEIKSYEAYMYKMISSHPDYSEL